MPAALRYQVLDRNTGLLKGYLSDDGTPTGAQVVVGEPSIAFELNAGARELQLQLTQNPLDSPLADHLAGFDLVRIVHPDGRHFGDWKYELSSAAETDTAAQYTLHLTPLAAELTDVDFAGNYTPIPDTEGQPTLGAATWDVPVRAAVARTKHCSLGTIVSDGVAYDMAYPKWSRGVDTLNKAIDQGGPDWWWFVDGAGVVELRQGARNTFSLAYLSDVIREDVKSWDATPLMNVQPVTGGTVQGTAVFGGLSYATSVPLTSFAEEDDDANPYSTGLIGRRVAQVWSDSTAMSQASVDALAQQLLERKLVPVTTIELRLRPGAPLVQPGDKANYLAKSGITYSGLWVKSVEELGATRVQVVSLVSQFDMRQRPFRARKDAAAAGSGGLSSPPLPGGGSCGGYQPLARTIPGSVSGTSGGSSFDPIRCYFVLDSGGTCQIDVRGYFSLKFTKTNPGDDGTCTVTLMCDTGDETGAAALSAALHMTADGEWHPVALAAPSGRPLADSTYQAYLHVTGPAGTWQLDYDIQVWLYAGGSGL